MPCQTGNCGGGGRVSNDVRNVARNNARNNGGRGRRDNQEHDKTDRGCGRKEHGCPRDCCKPCCKPCPRPCDDDCKKPCCCPKNNVCVAYIRARGKAGRGAPTFECADCEFYLQTCSCTLWKCVDGAWVRVEDIQTKWYYYQECNETIWKICSYTTRCRTRCNIENIGDKSCDGDLFIDSHTCEIFRYHRCRWTVKAKCGGTEIFFTTLAQQKINIVSRFSEQNAVKSFIARDAMGADVVVKNSYYEKSSKRLYRFDDATDAWTYTIVPNTTKNIIDAWGTFYRIGGGAPEGPKQGDLLVDGSDCSFYTWDECTASWIFQTSFNCGACEEQESPKFFSLTDVLDFTGSIKGTQYATSQRGDAGIVSLNNGDLTVSDTAVYSINFDFTITFPLDLVDNGDILVAIILNNNIVSGTLASTIIVNMYTTGAKMPIMVNGNLSTVAALNAGDVISIYMLNIGGTILLNVLYVTNFTIVQYVKGCPVEAVA